MTGELPKGTYPQIEELLVKEGYFKVYVWHDDPGQHYPPHVHEETVCLVVTAGSMQFSMNGEQSILRPGDRIVVPLGTEHTSTALEQGCDFVEGEVL